MADVAVDASLRVRLSSWPLPAAGGAVVATRLALLEAKSSPHGQCGVSAPVREVGSCELSARSSPTRWCVLVFLSLLGFL